MNIDELYAHFLDSRGISTDTRQLKPGQLFLTLKGPRFNGNDHVQTAFDSGAAGAIVDEPQGVVNDQCYLVEDALTALQSLARHHREQLDLTVIAITGSNGKTTTKELTQAVMQSHYNSFATIGNLNNHIGLPLSVLSLQSTHEFAILELGDNHPGEVALLSSICQPQYGVITNVGMDHLEGFGSMEANIAAKKELYDYLANHNGTAIINPTLPYLPEMARQVKPQIHYGEEDTFATQGELVAADPFIQLRFKTADGQWQAIKTQLIGAYNYHNALAAIAIGQHFGVPDEKIGRSLAEYIPTNNRSQVVDRGSYQVLLDAYNANPSNVAAALESFERVTSTKKAIFLGDMLELGPFAAAEHERIARMAQQINPTTLVLVGNEFEPIASKLGIQHFSTVDTARNWFIEQDWSDYWLLIKGSRGIAMERLLD